MTTVAEAHGLTADQLDALEQEFEALRAGVGGPARSRRRGLHPAADTDTAVGRSGRAGVPVPRLPPPVLVGRRGRTVPLEDPRQHGDRPQRPARPVRLDEGPRPLLDQVRMGFVVSGQGLAALPQLSPPHLYQHHREGPGPRVRRHQDQWGVGLVACQPRQPPVCTRPGPYLRLGHHVPRCRSRTRAQGEEALGRGEALLEERAAQVRQARLPRLHHVARPHRPTVPVHPGRRCAGQRGAQHLVVHHHFLRSLSERRAGVHRRGVRGRVEGSLVFPADTRVRQHQGQPALPHHVREPEFPD